MPGQTQIIVTQKIHTVFYRRDKGEMKYYQTTSKRLIHCT